MLTNAPAKELELAKVLLVDDNAASRLTLQAVLQAGGYFVDAACSADEALGKMDEHQYELILSYLHSESPEPGLEILAQARLMDYQPAIALLTTSPIEDGNDPLSTVLIEPQDVPEILGKVADLISRRAARLVERQEKGSSPMRFTTASN